MNRLCKITSAIFGLFLVVAMTGCQSADSAVKARCLAFNQALLADDMSKATDYVDPALVKKTGTVILEGTLRGIVKLASGLAKLATGGEEVTNVEIREVMMSADHQSATVKLVYMTAKVEGKDPQEFPQEQQWKLIDGKWYWVSE